MYYKPTIVLVDDQVSAHENFLDVSEEMGVSIIAFVTWDKAKEYLEKNIINIDGLILDAKGKINADRQESAAHLNTALLWINQQVGKGNIIPYAIYTAHADNLETFSEEQSNGRMFRKPNETKKVLEFLIREISNSEKFTTINQYPEPFNCFGGNYLDKKYETLLLDIIIAFNNKALSDSKNLLFNPCRTILEQVFKKITEVNEKVLPYALLNFEDQRVGLANCSKYLSGSKVYINKNEYQRSKYFDDYISQQVQTIIYVCHPASHEIQNKYTDYTFMSVLYALLDVLIWLKAFIDKNGH